MTVTLINRPVDQTIAAMHVLEKEGFHGMVMDAVDAACRRSKELAGK